MAIIRNYNTLAEFNSEPIHPENKICFIKDKAILYSNGVQYSPSKMELISNIGDSDNIVDKFNELRTNLLKSNLMAPRTPNTIIYYAGPSNTISIGGTSYTAESDKINIDGVEYYKIKLDKDLDDNFYKFDKNTFTNLIFKDVDTSNVSNMNRMFYGCNNITSLDVSRFDTSKVSDMIEMFKGCNALKTIKMIGCSQTTIDKIKAQLATDGITSCTIVTE